MTNSGRSSLGPKQAAAVAIILATILIGNGVVAITAMVHTQHFFLGGLLATLLVLALVLLLRGARKLIRNAIPGRANAP